MRTRVFFETTSRPGFGHTAFEAGGDVHRAAENHVVDAVLSADVADDDGVDDVWKIRTDALRLGPT
jgi:hypothetical protein